MRRNNHPLLALIIILIISLVGLYALYSKVKNKGPAKDSLPAEIEISLEDWPPTGDGSPESESSYDIREQIIQDPYKILPYDEEAYDTQPESQSEPSYQSGLNRDIILSTEVMDTDITPDTPLICIDPGHYKDSSTLEGTDLYGYGEGIFTIKLAKLLVDELKRYGIRSYLTREGDSITLGGYTDEALDKGHISLRGEYARGADLFISLHTNGNAEGSNGRQQNDQPLSLNKSFVILNQAALNSDIAVNAANTIGLTLTEANHKRGLSWTDVFHPVEKSTITMWESGYNDGIFNYGSVFQRKGSRGDYYGVLRGSSNVNVPGMIVEHGYHTIPEVRRQAMLEDLAEDWARADAYGIAVGFGLAGVSDLSH